MIALPQNLGFTNRDDVIAIGNLPFRPIEPAMLDEDHWVVVANSCLQQSFGVGGIGRHDDFQTGDMCEPGFETLRVVRTHGAADAALDAHGQRNF